MDDYRVLAASVEFRLGELAQSNRYLADAVKSLADTQARISTALDNTTRQAAANGEKITAIMVKLDDTRTHVFAIQRAQSDARVVRNFLQATWKKIAMVIAVVTSCVGYVVGLPETIKKLIISFSTWR